MANEVKINITTKADISGVQKTNSALKSLKKTADESSESLAKKADAFQKYVGKITGLIVAIRKVFSAFAIIGLITFAIGQIKALYEWIQKLATAAEREAVEAFKKLADALNAQSLQRIVDKNKEIAKSFKEVADAIENVTDKMAHKQELEDMQNKNADTLAKSERDIARSNELANASSALSRAVINEKYDRIEVEESRKIAVRDARTKADRFYNADIAKNFAMQQATNSKAQTSQQASIIAAGSIVNNLKAVIKKEGISDEDKNKAREDLKKAEAQLVEEQEKLVTLKKEQTKLAREELQAQEKRKQALKEINVANKQASAQIAALDDAHNQRYYAQEANKAANQYEYESKELALSQADDRIAKMGGFSSLGTKTAAGVVSIAMTEKLVRQGEKQTKELATQTVVLQKINTNTESSGARFM